MEVEVKEEIPSPEEIHFAGEFIFYLFCLFYPFPKILLCGRIVSIFSKDSSICTVSKFVHAKQLLLHTKFLFILSFSISYKRL